MIRAVILLVLAACASSKSAEQHAEVVAEAHGATHAEEQAAASGRTTAGPETITTTVEEWAAPEKATAPEGAVGLIAGTTPNKPTEGGSIPSAPLLVKRTVTVDQRGPVDSSWMASASGTHGAEQETAMRANTASQSASSWKLGLPWLTLAMLGAALALAWKTGWLGKALSILGKLF